jgi:cytochrome c553
MRSRYGETRIGNIVSNDETSVDSCSKKKEAMKQFARLCAGLCLIASVAAARASCESTPALQSAPVAQTRGKAIYQRDCVACHAQQGTGDAFMAVPALAGQRFEYLREQIGNFATDKRHNPRMQWAFARASTKPLQSADDLATYLSHLPEQRFASGDPRFHAEGEKDYAALCAACHAADARGNPAGTIPSIRAQHDSYLVNRLRVFAFASPTIRIAAHEVDDHTIVAVAAYLSSLRGVDDDSAKPAPP